MKLLCFIFAIPYILCSQQDSMLSHFIETKHSLNKKGMIVLGCWGGANIIAGAVGYAATKSYEEKNFYAMNSLWGLINLGIALPGVYSKKPRVLNLFKTQQEQNKVEKIYLSNAMFDLLYLSGGAFLKEYAINQTSISKRQQFNGFGNSFLVQGGSLLLFDLSMLYLNNRNRKKNLDRYIQNSQICFSLNSVKIRYRFN